MTSDIRGRMARYYRIAAMLLCLLPGFAADEKRHARWVRQVTAIELGRVEDPGWR